jgi:hypothetical protein
MDCVVTSLETVSRSKAPSIGAFRAGASRQQRTRTLPIAWRPPRSFPGREALPVFETPKATPITRAARPEIEVITCVDPTHRYEIILIAKASSLDLTDLPSEGESFTLLCSDIRGRGGYMATFNVGA